MSAPFEHRKVLPHGPPAAVDDPVRTVIGTLRVPVAPRGELRGRCESLH